VLTWTYVIEAMQESNHKPLLRTEHPNVQIFTSTFLYFHFLHRNSSSNVETVDKKFCFHISDLREMKRSAKVRFFDTSHKCFRAG
jgi:hypothetical protein